MVLIAAALAVAGCADDDAPPSATPDIAEDPTVEQAPDEQSADNSSDEDMLDTFDSSTIGLDYAVQEYTGQGRAEEMDSMDMDVEEDIMVDHDRSTNEVRFAFTREFALDMGDGEMAASPSFEINGMDEDGMDRTLFVTPELVKTMGDEPGTIISYPSGAMTVDDQGATVDLDQISVSVPLSIDGVSVRLRLDWIAEPEADEEADPAEPALPVVIRYGAGPVDLSVSAEAFPVDPTLESLAVDDYRFGMYEAAGYGDDVERCGLERIFTEAEFVALQLGFDLGELVQRCGYEAAIADSVVGAGVADAAAGFGYDASGVAGCVADVIDTGVSFEEMAVAFGEPDIDDWPAGLPEAYADALEICFPLRPFYAGIFLATEFENPDCADIMTDAVVGKYPWIEQLRLGVHDPDRRAQGQEIFAADVGNMYAANNCFAAS